jgi:hypothetical protein
VSEIATSIVHARQVYSNANSNNKPSPQQARARASDVGDAISSSSSQMWAMKLTAAQ